MAKTKELKKSPFMGQKKAKNRHVSFGKSRLARAALPFKRKARRFPAQRARSHTLD